MSDPIDNMEASVEATLARSGTPSDCAECGREISSERQIHNVGTDVCGDCAKECKPCTAP